MDKLLTNEMQATLRILRRVGSVIECDAEDCRSDAQGELIELIHELDGDDPAFELEGRQQLADQARAALEVHDTRQRIGLTARMHIGLWRRVTIFLDG